MKLRVLSTAEYSDALSAIEEQFDAVKEIWGAGEQQVRNVWSNIGCWNLCGWLSTLVELASWDQPRDSIPPLFAKLPEPLAIPRIGMANSFPRIGQAELFISLIAFANPDYTCRSGATLVPAYEIRAPVDFSGRFLKDLPLPRHLDLSRSRAIRS